MPKAFAQHNSSRSQRASLLKGLIRQVALHTCNRMELEQGDKGRFSHENLFEPSEILSRFLRIRGGEPPGRVHAHSLKERRKIYSSLAASKADRME